MMRWEWVDTAVIAGKGDAGKRGWPTVRAVNLLKMLGESRCIIFFWKEFIHLIFTCYLILFHFGFTFWVHLFVNRLDGLV